MQTKHHVSFWRALAAPVVLLAVLLLGAGCGKKEAPGAINLWTFTDDALMQGLLKKFEQANPGVTVKHRQLSWEGGLEQLLVAISGGNAPDVAELGSTWVARFAADGQLADLGPGFGEMSKNLTLVETGTYDGKLVALPWLVGSRCLFYNKALFKKAGLDPEKPPVTWTDWLAAAQKINTLGGKVGGFGSNSGEGQILFKRYLPLLWSAGGDVLSPDKKQVTLTTSQAKRALDFMVTLSKTGPIQSQKETDQLFVDGLLGMMVSGAWVIKKAAAENPSLDYGVALLPHDETSAEKAPYSFAGAEVLVRFNGAKNPKGADKLMAFLMQKPQTGELARALPYLMPADKDAAADKSWITDPRQEVFARQMAFSRDTPQVPEWVKMEEIITLQVEKALAGEDPAVMLGEGQEKMQAVLEGK